MTASRVVSAVLILSVSGICDAGSCTSADLKKMNALPNDTSDSSFGGKSAKCGRSAYHIFGGFKQDEFNSCLTAAVGISTSCASCYAVAADYGAKNCKEKCMSGWCKSGCLSCTANAIAAASKCSGRPNTQVKPCLSEETLPLPVAKVEEAAVATGACTADDNTKIDAMPKDTSDNSFAAKSADCGKSAYSIWSGNFDQGEFNTCMKKSVGISTACSGCYAVAGAYGASNCKSDCLFGWCKEGCLGCTGTACAKANTCAGRPNYQPKPCLSSAGNATIEVVV